MKRSLAQDEKCAVPSESCVISPLTLKSIYLISVVGSYESGVYGLKRLQKVTYLSERNSELKPFTFKKHLYGQYSEELANINNNLIELGFIDSNVLQDTECCVYSVASKVDLSYYEKVLASIDHKIIEAIKETIDEFGYLPEEKLVKLCYSLPDFKAKKAGDIVVKAVMPDTIIVPGLKVEECENLDLTFSSPFVKAMSLIVDSLDRATINFDKVKKVAITL